MDPNEEIDLEKADRGDEVRTGGSSPLDKAGKGDEKALEDEKDTPKEQEEEDEKDSLTDEDDEGKGGEKDEEEGEETDEEKAEREAKEAEEKRKKNIRIPKARFDEALEKARQREEALQRKIDALEKQSTTKKDQAELKSLREEVSSLADKYEDLLVEGKKEEAREVRRSMEAKRDELYERTTAAKSESAKRSAIEELKYDSALARHESLHPELNPDSDAFDETTVTEVSELLEAFVARGFTRHAALDRAVKYVLGEPKKEEAKDDKSEERDVLRAKREKEARKKAAEAAAKQPAATDGVGKDSDKGGKADDPEGIDVLKLSQKKFQELTEEQLSRLRGDSL